MEEREKVAYINEHVSCRSNQVTEQGILRMREMKENQLIIRDHMESPVLVFVLQGSLQISSGSFVKADIQAGHFFLIAAGDGFYGKALSHSLLLVAYLRASIALCGEFTFKQLGSYLKRVPAKKKRAGFLLPIAPILEKELTVACEVLQTGLFCLHYQKSKLDILLLHLCAFYEKEQLALLFEPLFTEDNEFVDMVIRLYPQVANVNELIMRSGLSTSTFNRRFLKNFGITVGNWMTVKRKESILKDIMTTDLSIREIAERNFLTPNYMISFCKRHFGKTPAELREQQWLG